MQYTKRTFGFTFVELMMVVAILAILASVSFFSYQNYIKNARDSQRITDLNSISKSLDLYLTQNSSLPAPTSGKQVTFSGQEVWTQGTFGASVLDKVENPKPLPHDPRYDMEYTYSVLNTDMEYQIAGVLEDSQDVTMGSPFSAFPDQAAAASTSFVRPFIKGNYNNLVAKVETGSTVYVLAVPSIILSDLSNPSIEGLIASGSNMMVTDGALNLPASYAGEGLDLTASSGAFTVFKKGLPKVILWSDSTLPSSNTGALTLIANMKSTYNGTITAQSPTLSPILSMTDNIELVKKSNEIVIRYLGGEAMADILAVDQDPSKLSITTSCNLSASGGLTLQTDLYNSSKSGLQCLFSSSLSQYASSWGSGSCSDSPDIIDVSDAASFDLNMNGKTLATNTIYRVANGRYKVSGTITLPSCSAIVGQSESGVQFERSFQPSVLLSAGMNSVIYQLTVDGESLSATGYDDGQGDDVYTFTGGTSCEMSTTGTGGIFNHITVQDVCTSGLCINTRSATFNDVIVRGSVTNGVFVSSASGNVLTNLETSRNGTQGLQMSASPNNRFTSMNVYSNGGNGIYLQTFSTNSNIFTNIRTYSNRLNGVNVTTDVHDNSFNNLQSYNNQVGVFTTSSAYRNSFNNVLAYNNAFDGVSIQSYGTGHILNNAQIFNNRGRGVYLFGNAGNILNNVSVYNNTTTGSFTQDGIGVSTGGGSYFGLLKMFGNIVNTNPLSVGTGLGALGWTNGVLSQTGSMDCTLHANPDGYYTPSGCLEKGTGILASPSVSYSYGTGFMNQVQPVISVGTGLYLYGTGGIDYDVTKKIGQF